MWDFLLRRQTSVNMNFLTRTSLTVEITVRWSINEKKLRYTLNRDSSSRKRLKNFNKIPAVWKSHHAAWTATEKSNFCRVHWEAAERQTLRRCVDTSVATTLQVEWYASPVTDIHKTFWTTNSTGLTCKIVVCWNILIQDTISRSSLIRRIIAISASGFEKCWYAYERLDRPLK